MKKILLTLTVALAMAGAAFASNNLSVIVKTVADVDVPEVAGGSNIRFTTVAFIGQRAARTLNTGNVWIQRSSANGAPGIKLEPGKMISITSQLGLDAADFWIDVETAGDGVVMVIIN